MDTTTYTILAVGVMTAGVLSLLFGLPDLIWIIREVRRARRER